VAEAAATDIAGTLHIRVEVVVLLVVGAHNLNSSQALSRRWLWLRLYLSLLA
jgi:hypothetical protein